MIQWLLYAEARKRKLQSKAFCEGSNLVLIGGKTCALVYLLKAKIEFK